MPQLSTIDYGTDLVALTDMDPNGRIARGVKFVAQEIARRILTPRGAVIGCPDDGIDVRDYMGQNLTARDMPRIQGEIAAEISKDVRVDTFTVKCTLTQVSGTTVTPRSLLTIEVAGVCSPGPFAFVLNVDEVTVEFLEQSI